MSDLLLALLWTFLVTAGLAGAVVLRRRGVAEARIRDLLHVGAGVWVFGWPAWERAWVAVAIPWAAVALLAALPLFAAREPHAASPGREAEATSPGRESAAGRGGSRHGAAGQVVEAVTSDEERWGGLVLYALAFALLTSLALATPLGAAPAAGGLLALAWGDGLGGAVGSRLGRRGYHLPWTKRKTWVGSAVVAAATMAGVLAWSGWSAWVAAAGAAAGGSAAAGLTAAGGLAATAVPGLPAVVGAGLVAAVAEAISPRGTDNLVVPVGVFVWLVQTAP